MTDLQDYLAVAVRAAQAAGKIQQFYAGGDLDIQTKSSETDLVTKADKLCEAKIREIIAAAYPEHVVLGEEGGQDGEASHRWIVDPIDGTLNYAHGLPYYCTSIALEVEGEIQVGVILDSLHAELFTATKGGGAFLNGAPISVTSETELINSMLTTGFSYQKEGQRKNIAVFEHLNAQVRSIRRLGCVSVRSSVCGLWSFRRFLGTQTSALGCGGGLAISYRSRWHGHGAIWGCLQCE